MSSLKEEQDAIWDTDHCVVDDSEPITIANRPRAAKEYINISIFNDIPTSQKEFYNILKEHKGKIRSKDYDEFVIKKPDTPVATKPIERGLTIDCVKAKRFLNVTADNSPDSALEIVKIKNHTPGYKEFMEYTIEKKRMLWLKAKDKPSHEIMKDFLN